MQTSWFEGELVYCATAASMPKNSTEVRFWDQKWMAKKNRTDQNLIFRKDGEKPNKAFELELNQILKEK